MARFALRPLVVPVPPNPPSPVPPKPTTAPPAPLHLAVIGAGPVGLALALQAARSLPDAAITVFDARTAEHPIAADPRTLALSLGSVQELQRLGVWYDGIAAHAEPIRAVHVSQQQPVRLWPLPPGREPSLLLRAQDHAVEQFGAVAAYGAIVAPLQRAWQAECRSSGGRCTARWGSPVVALKDMAGDVEVDAGVVERFDLAVVAEGGVFAEQDRKALARDYGQTAWVGTVSLREGQRGTAYERFTPHGPAALLPLPPGPDPGVLRAALVWCVPSAADPVRELTDAQRLGVLNAVFAPGTGHIVAVSALKPFSLGLNAERTLVNGRQVRIGNAAQTLHPVAGQGLNLGLRDAHVLVAGLRGTADIDAALRRIEWQRAPDRWSMIAATDFLARSFTWDLPGLSTLRGAGLAWLQHTGPAQRWLARRMMFGLR